MKLQKRQLLFLCFTLLWMGIIFWFSANTGSESSSQSSRLVEWIGKFFFPNRSEWTLRSQEAWIGTVTLLVRKAAHATEYLILGLLLLGCQPMRTPLRRAVPSAWILTVCYAASDEIHQCFVPDRAGRFTDVLIDSIGAAAGLLLFCLITKYRRNRQYRKTS